jgi:hypothetical protein
LPPLTERVIFLGRFCVEFTLTERVLFLGRFCVEFLIIRVSVGVVCLRSAFRLKERPRLFFVSLEWEFTPTQLISYHASLKLILGLGVVALIPWLL